MTFTYFREIGLSRVSFFAVRLFKEIETLDDMAARFQITQSEFLQILGVMR